MLFGHLAVSGSSSSSHLSGRGGQRGQGGRAGALPGCARWPVFAALRSVVRGALPWPAGCCWSPGETARECYAALRLTACSFLLRRVVVWPRAGRSLSGHPHSGSLRTGRAR
jgi:hypothetical protein